MSFGQHNQILLNLWQNVENPVMFGDHTPIETQHFEQQVTKTAQNHTVLVGPDGKPHTIAILVLYSTSQFLHYYTIKEVCIMSLN